jgi:CcmD family protein
MKSAKSILIIVIAMLYAGVAEAETEMADSMRANGKIYVVVAVLATIFAGIFAYLFILDRKIARIEKEN